MIVRTFQPLAENMKDDSILRVFRSGATNDITWATLLESQRILIVSEAGVGKTYECERQQKKLWEDGEPAFYLELANLTRNKLEDILDEEEELRLLAWRRSHSDVATFFLDSIDELKLTQGKFETALKKFKKGIGGDLGRARVVITTRPIPYDEQVVRRVLPVPVRTNNSSEDVFAAVALGQSRADNDDVEQQPVWRTVSLEPMTESQIAEFAVTQHVTDPEMLLTDLRNRNAMEFANRPQDLIELCADWNEHRRIRTHREQVESNIGLKLQAQNDDRQERIDLPLTKAIEGASRLALAMLVMRLMTIRYSAAADEISSETVALDPMKILKDWSRDEVRTLLERPLFGFASYGRVRFHHRSAVEYLAAKRLLQLRQRGMSFRALKRLIFAETKEKIIVRPTKRPVAAWLALECQDTFALLRDNEASVLLNDGDPESLTPTQRKQALRNFVLRHGQGSWRGLRVPHIQIHRFSSAILADEINSLWKQGVENPEVRDILLYTIEAGKITECADIAFCTAIRKDAESVERIIAIDALVSIEDPRLNDIAHELAENSPQWTSAIASAAILRLFSQYLSIPQLSQVLSWIDDTRRSDGDLGWRLPQNIRQAGLKLEHLEELRDGLVQLATDGLRWQQQWPYITNDRPFLSEILAVTCNCGLEKKVDSAWLRASIVAIHIRGNEHYHNNEHDRLQTILRNLEASDNATLFWVEDEFLQSLYSHTDPWKRLVEVICREWQCRLQVDRDLSWVKESLVDNSLEPQDRALMLEAAMTLIPQNIARLDHLADLKPLVDDSEPLSRRILERMTASKDSLILDKWEKNDTKRKAQQERRHAKNRASWMQFWRDLSFSPENAFSAEQSFSTAWNLRRVMIKAGEDSRESGWNRRFIEENFGKELADQLRNTLMSIWRHEQPTLPSERREEKRYETLVCWQLGVTAIYAEAEDPTWAKNLSVDEAKLAARYALVQLNGLPPWLQDLVMHHAQVVDSVIGQELSWELKLGTHGQGVSMLIQSVSHAGSSIANVFLERLLSWLVEEGDHIDSADSVDLGHHITRLRQVVTTLLHHGDNACHQTLLDIARKRLSKLSRDELAKIWLPVLVNLAPADGVEELESRIKNVIPSIQSSAVDWFSFLFGEHGTVNLMSPKFTSHLLLRLLRLAYRHVRIEDDVEHDGVYEADTRDYAERARNQLVKVLFEIGGEEGWRVKTEMASDPLFSHFKDRILAVAEEHWANDIDAHAFSFAQAIQLDNSGESPPSTNEAMYTLMRDRLCDIDELLLSDDSPRENWAAIKDEKLMRREITRTLRTMASNLYKVNQEAVTGDEKETDIRLVSMASTHEAVIELKLADNRSGRDLRDTVHDQLVKRYMAPENRRAGCLLFTLSKNKNFDDPETGDRLNVEGLLKMLRKEAKRIEGDFGSAIAVYVHFLDLRPRL